MDKERLSWESSGKESDSKSEGGKEAARRFRSIPRVVLTGEEQKTTPRPEGSERPKASVVQLIARPELLGRPPVVELPQDETEAKKKKRKGKKGKEVVVPRPEDQLAPAIELPKDTITSDNDKKEDAAESSADDYQPIEIKLEKPKGADYGGEVIYLHDYAEPKATQEAEGPAEKMAAAFAPLADALPFLRQPEQQPMQGEASAADGPRPEVVPEQRMPEVEPPATVQPAAEFVPLPSLGGTGGNGGRNLPPSGGNREVPSPGGGSGNGGEQPPEFGGVAGVSPQPLYQEWDPARIYREHIEREAQAAPVSFAGGVSPSEQVVTKREHNNALYRAEKTGQNRGVAAGLVAGWWLGRRFLRKKMTREFAAKTKEQDKKINQTETTLHFSQEEQAKQRSEIERQRLELNRYQAAVSSQQAERTRAAALAGGTLSRVAERHPGAPEQRERREQQPVVQRPEQAQVQPNRVALEPQSENQVAVPPEHVIQSSAWHHIEVDTRTGRPVETPSFQYGQEYYRERAQEAMPIAQRNAAAGEVALVAATAAGASGGDDTTAAKPSGSSGQPGASSSSSPYIPSANTQGAPTPQPGRSSSGPIWPYLVALVVIVLCLAWLLH